MLGLFWYDYLIFLIVLAISTFTGIYYGCFGTKQRTINEYLLGGKKMAIIPIAISVAVSHFSAIMIIGGTVDVYKFGAYFFYAMISTALLGVISVYVFFPTFFKLQVTSIYKYLEKRFDNKTKQFVAFLYIICEMITVAVCIYAPSLVLSIATGYHVYPIIICVFGICIFYTMIGGLKIVVWTDFFQLGVILLSLFIICVFGFNTTGNFASVWKTALNGGRLDILNFNPDPTERDTFWTYIFGFTLHWINYVTLSQSGVQKYLSLPTFRHCVWAVIFYVITMQTVQLLCVVLGLLIYAQYSKCDPLLNGKIQRHEQLLPYYVMEVAGHIPGISGFFLVGLFCSSMSTVSSSLNAISGVVYKDFLIKYLKNYIKESTSGKILRLLVLIFGILSIILVLILEHLGDILPLVISAVSIGSGPNLGIFSLAFLFPKANARGAFYGGIVAFVFQSVVFIVSKIYRFKKIIVDVPKRFSVEGCLTNTSLALVNSTMSIPNNTLTASNNVTANFKPFFIFRMTYHYNCLSGMIITVVVGLIISYFTNKNDPPVDKILISPVVHRFLPKEVQRNGDTVELKTLMNNDSNTENK